mgnify:CR=1 FL=1
MAVGENNRDGCQFFVGNSFGDEIGVIAGVDDNAFIAVGNEITIGGKIANGESFDGKHWFILPPC